jgi:hypothetical protein
MCVYMWHTHTHTPGCTPLDVVVMYDECVMWNFSTCTHDIYNMLVRMHSVLYVCSHPHLLCTTYDAYLPEVRTTHKYIHVVQV